MRCKLIYNKKESDLLVNLISIWLTFLIFSAFYAVKMIVSFFFYLAKKHKEKAAEMAEKKRQEKELENLEALKAEIERENNELIAPVLESFPYMPKKHAINYARLFLE